LGQHINIKINAEGLAEMEVNMKVKGKKNKEKIVSICIVSALLCTLGIGVFSVVSGSKDNNDVKNNVVDLNEQTTSDNKTDNIVGFNAEDANEVSKDTESIFKGDVNEKENAGMENVGKDSQEEQTTEPVTESVENTAETEKVADVAADAKLDPMTGYSFDENSELLWPVSGPVALKYSMDNTIYFKTLGAYKCNPAMCISAEVGTNVGVAADGIVESVTESKETGTTVSVAVGNDYVVTYGLLDNVNVKAGDKVSKEQLLGTIAEPTAYYKEEGPILYFMLTKDDMPIDPNDFLVTSR